MDTTITPNDISAAIETWENHLIDRQLAVESARDDVHAALAALCEAVRERDRVRQHLCHLIDCASQEAA